MLCPSVTAKARHNLAGFNRSDVHGCLPFFVSRREHGSRVEMKRGSWKIPWNGRCPFLPAPSEVEGPVPRVSRDCSGTVGSRTH